MADEPRPPAGAWRTYLELASGLGETSRKRVRRVVKDLIGKGNATAEQLRAASGELLAANAANREALGKLVKVEVDRALGRVGLATMDEVNELTARVRDLERQLREARGVNAGTTRTVSAGAGRPTATSPMAKKTVRKATKAPATGTRPAATRAKAARAAAPAATTAKVTTAKATTRRTTTAKAMAPKATTAKTTAKKATAKKATAKKATAKATVPPRTARATGAGRTAQ